MSRWRGGAALAALAAVSACSERGDDGVAGPAPEGGAPRAVALAPAPGNDYVATDQDFVVEFSHPMQTSSVEGAYSVVVGGRPVWGRFAWSDDHRAMGFRPAAPLAAGAQVQVGWGAGMRDAQDRPLTGDEGEPLEPFDFTCTAYAAPSQFVSAGQQIYFTATSPSGEEITFTMGDDFGGAHMPGYGAMGPGGTGMIGSGTMDSGMMGSGTGVGSDGALAGRHYGMACVSCHGPQGEGGRYLAMGTVRAPSLRYAVLIGQESGGEEQEGAEHVPYDDAAIARAITEGIDPDGEDLSGFMPRWSMSPADLQALVEYLKTL